MACDRIAAEHNQAELSRLEYRQQTVFNTGASGKVTGTTRHKVRVGNPATSRLDESSGKTLNAYHDTRRRLRDLTIPITSLSR